MSPRVLAEVTRTDPDGPGRDVATDRSFLGEDRCVSMCRSSVTTGWSLMERRLGVAAAIVDGGRVTGDVAIADGCISAVGCSPPGASGLATPGLVDVHVHGCGGSDFLTSGGDGYRRAGQRLLAAGVTAVQPTFTTAPLPQLCDALATLRELQATAVPRLLGAHLEGPFLAPDRLGTHDPDQRLDPDPAAIVTLLEAGPVGEVTLAPELPGALDVVGLLVRRGVVVSLGHSDATAEQAQRAADRGARSVTHVFNAMRPLHHREPGIAGWALAHPGVFVELIVDGHHLHPDIVTMVWRSARGRALLVTDGTAAAGMPDGSFRLGDVALTVADGAVYNTDGALAGSAITLLDAVRNLHALGVALVDAVDAATRVPARLLGRSDIGHLRVGAPADIAVLDDDTLDVRETLVAGRSAHAA
jgi:N-acetylglucosamine-6-phosphate deacetylase